MSLRSIPPHFDVERLADVDARLAGIVRDHRVTIGLAIESGSRAWGFPSPDSDYDCRFLFVRPMEDYLSPWQKRDVIETPLEDDMDVNGWELGKAIKLLLKGNAVVIEWLMSPIVYAGVPEFRDGLLGLANAHTDRAAVARHYLHLGVSGTPISPITRRSRSRRSSMRCVRPPRCAGCGFMPMPRSRRWIFPPCSNNATRQRR